MEGMKNVLEDAILAARILLCYHNERKIDEALQNSLLNEEYKQKLKDYANMMKKKIEEEKKRMKSEMEKM